MARISVGGAFSQVALAAVVAAGRELLDHGTYGFAVQAGRSQAGGSPSGACDQTDRTSRRSIDAVVPRGVEIDTFHMPRPATFKGLVAEGESIPVEGWDFSWFEGRATQERPTWGYSRLVAERMASATAALDIQTGGGEVLARLPQLPAVLAATESWPPNLALARRKLEELGVTVVEVTDDAVLPFPASSFDLMVSRHPTVTRWMRSPGSCNRAESIFPNRLEPDRSANSPTS